MKSKIFTVSEDSSVFDALCLMDKENIGAVLILKNDKVVGIFSERDYARKIVLKERSSRNTPINEVMTKDVISVSPNHNLEECLKIMTEKRIRHLPIIENEKLMGFVSIGDIVKRLLEKKDDEIQQLYVYITGYPVITHR